jgi:hypothetical protein
MDRLISHLGCKSANRLALCLAELLSLRGLAAFTMMLFMHGAFAFKDNAKCDNACQSTALAHVSKSIAEFKEDKKKHTFYVLTQINKDLTKVTSKDNTLRNDILQVREDLEILRMDFLDIYSKKATIHLQKLNKLSSQIQNGVNCQAVTTEQVEIRDIIKNLGTKKITYEQNSEAIDTLLTKDKKWTDHSKEIEGKIKECNSQKKYGITDVKAAIDAINKLGDNSMGQCLTKLRIEKNAFTDIKNLIENNGNSTDLIISKEIEQVRIQAILDANKVEECKKKTEATETLASSTAPVTASKAEISPTLGTSNNSDKYLSAFVLVIAMLFGVVLSGGILVLFTKHLKRKMYSADLINTIAAKVLSMQTKNINDQKVQIKDMVRNEINQFKSEDENYKVGQIKALKLMIADEVGAQISSKLNSQKVPDISKGPVAHRSNSDAVQDQWNIVGNSATNNYVNDKSSIDTKTDIRRVEPRTPVQSKNPSAMLAQIGDILAKKSLGEKGSTIRDLLSEHFSLYPELRFVTTTVNHEEKEGAGWTYLRVAGVLNGVSYLFVRPEDRAVNAMNTFFDGLENVNTGEPKIVETVQPAIVTVSPGGIPKMEKKGRVAWH